jgi:hypothetical protein
VAAEGAHELVARHGLHPRHAGHGGGELDGDDAVARLDQRREERSDVLAARGGDEPCNGR